MGGKRVRELVWDARRSGIRQGWAAPGLGDLGTLREGSRSSLPPLPLPQEPVAGEMSGRWPCLRTLPRLRSVLMAALSPQRRSAARHGPALRSVKKKKITSPALACKRRTWWRLVLLPGAEARPRGGRRRRRRRGRGPTWRRAGLGRAAAALERPTALARLAAPTPATQPGPAAAERAGQERAGGAEAAPRGCQAEHPPLRRPPAGTARRPEPWNRRRSST